MIKQTVIGILLVVSGCSNNAKLDARTAQDALSQWVGAKGTVIVDGVVQGDDSSAARADVRFPNFTFDFREPILGRMSRQDYSGTGQASFVRYTDGRWVLKSVSLSRPGMFGPMQWDEINISATGDGSKSPLGSLKTTLGMTKSPSNLSKGILEALREGDLDKIRAISTKQFSDAGPDSMIPDFGKFSQTLKGFGDWKSMKVVSETIGKDEARVELDTVIGTRSQQFSVGLVKMGEDWKIAAVR